MLSVLMQLLSFLSEIPTARVIVVCSDRIFDFIILDDEVYGCSGFLINIFEALLPNLHR